MLKRVQHDGFEGVGSPRRAGLVGGGWGAYLGGMRYLSRFSPVAAYRDLRFFFSSRQPHEMWFLVASLCVTGFLIYAFAHDSYMEPVYRPKITYVQQWELTRTDAEIRAQQAIDEPIKQARLAAERKAREARQAEFKKMDDAMSKMGL
jgi:hypothetical protein